MSLVHTTRMHKEPADTHFPRHLKTSAQIIFSRSHFESHIPSGWNGSTNKYSRLSLLAWLLLQWPAGFLYLQADSWMCRSLDNISAVYLNFMSLARSFAICSFFPFAVAFLGCHNVNRGSWRTTPLCLFDSWQWCWISPICNELSVNFDQGVCVCVRVTEWVSHHHWFLLVYFF